MRTCTVCNILFATNGMFRCSFAEQTRQGDLHPQQALIQNLNNIFTNTENLGINTEYVKFQYKNYIRTLNFLYTVITKVSNQILFSHTKCPSLESVS